MSLSAAQAFCDTGGGNYEKMCRMAHVPERDSRLLFVPVMSQRVFVEGAIQMSRRSILVPETLNGRLILTLSVLAAVMVIQAILGASPALALSETPDNTYMTNGKVYATALSGDGKILYIGGEFTEVEQKSGTIAQAVSNVAAINVKTGAAIRTWRPKVSGDDAVVRSLAVKNGQVFIGGNFTAVEGEPRKNLAAVGANTKSVVLSPFKPQVGGDTSYVFALEAGDSQTLRRRRVLQGQRSAAQESGGVQPRDRGARPPLEAEATRAPTCEDPKCSHKVRALELAPGRKSIFVGGSFSYMRAPTAEGPRDRAWRAFTRPLVNCTRGRSQVDDPGTTDGVGPHRNAQLGSTAASGPGGIS